MYNNADSLSFARSYLGYMLEREDSPEINELLSREKTHLGIVQELFRELEITPDLNLAIVDQIYTDRILSYAIDKIGLDRKFLIIAINKLGIKEVKQIIFDAACKPLSKFENANHRRNYCRCILNDRIHPYNSKTESEGAENVCTR
jgi:hypothetical protein